MTSSCHSIALAVALIFVSLTSARADYDSHPDLRPENRCVHPHPVTGELVPFAEAGIDRIHCQRLLWDLPATTVVGTVAVAAPFHEDPLPRFPRGITDRPPPLYILDVAPQDGVSDDGKGYENPGPGRVPLCDDPDEIGWWAPIRHPDNTSVIGEDPTGTLHDVEDPTQIQSGPLFQLQCRRGTRASMGPWQLGRSETRYDANGLALLRFENTERLNRDVAAGRTTEMPDGAGGIGRVEWNTGSEYYNHFASHHGTCYYPGSALASSCDNPRDPKPREAYDPANAEAECREFQRPADGPDDPEGAGKCYSGDADVRCPGVGRSSVRDATQVPGRLLKEFPDGRGVPSVEDIMFNCDHHVVTQLPPGSYGVNELIDFRLQHGGVRNTNADQAPMFETEHGDVFGGAVGELIIQYFTEPANAGIEPLNWMFSALPDVATTFYPPFTIGYKELPWTAPYDLYMSMLVLHSHHRMVKGTINLTPNPVRANSSNPLCGGSKDQATPPLALYTNWQWEDAPICDYWLEPDGPVVMRKGQVLTAGCLVNNGVTPEAIKHGLVAGSTVEMLRTLTNGAIPDDPRTVPTSDWAPLLQNSPVGQQILYGTHDPENYRVVYKCSTVEQGGVAARTIPGATTVDALGATTKLCPPNPGFDADGDYIDGPYLNEAVCGEGGWCEPSTVVWADRAEDEMCIMVGHYYPLDRIGDFEGGGHDRAMQKLTSGDPAQMQDVGTPGNTPAADVVGRCWDCGSGL